MARSHADERESSFSGTHCLQNGCSRTPGAIGGGAVALPLRARVTSLPVRRVCSHPPGRGRMSVVRAERSNACVFKLRVHEDGYVLAAFLGCKGMFSTDCDPDRPAPFAVPQHRSEPETLPTAVFDTCYQDTGLHAEVLTTLRVAFKDVVPVWPGLTCDALILDRFRLSNVINASVACRAQTATSTARLCWLRRLAGQRGRSQTLCW